MINPIPAGQVQPPNTLTPITNPLSDWDNLPLSHSRIGWNNFIVDSSFTGAVPATTPNTYERWGATSSGSMISKFQLSSSSTVDYFGVAAHNLFSEGATQIQVSTAETIGGPMTLAFTVNVTSDDPIMELLTPIENVAEIQVFIPTGTTNREIGVLHIGQQLQMYQPIYGGHSPIDLSARTSYQSNNSESGQFLGRTVIRRGLETNYSYRHLDPDWLRVKFLPFMEHAKTLPFFIKWRPDLYETTAYGYTTADIQPVNMGGGHRLMSVNFNVKAHSDL